MLGTIFQLSAAFLFGYQIAFRNKKGISQSTSLQARVFVGGKEIATTSTHNAYYDTSMYRIGFMYLVIGYLVPLTNINIGDNLNPSPKIFLVIFVSIIMVIVGSNVSKIIAQIKIKFH